MVSYLFSVINKKNHWDKIYDILTTKYQKHFELILLVKKSNEQLEELLEFEKKTSRFRVFVFEDDMSENKMISQTIREIKGQSLIICRDYFDYATIMSDYLVEMGNKGVQVAFFRKVKKTSKLKAFFKKIYNKLIKTIFGYNLYDGDVGLMYFNDIPLSTLKTVNHNVILTKVNKWLGFDMSYVEAEVLPKPTPEKRTLKKYIISLSLISALFLLTIAGLVLLSVFGKMTFIIGLAFVLFLSVFAFMILYNALKLSIINKVGDLQD